MNCEPIFRCLSIRQPAASLVVIGRKPIENRSWATSYRGAIAIHASSSYNAAWARELEERNMLPVGMVGYGRACWPAGAILGTVEIIDCLFYDGRESGRSQLIEAAKAAGVVGKGKKAIDRLVTWAEWGGYCWLLRNPVTFTEPIPAMGKLNLWRLSEVQQIAVMRSHLAATKQKGHSHG